MAQYESYIVSVVCPELASLDNGTVTLSTNGSVTVAELTCDSGSSISGSHQLTCKTDGLWDGMEQVCGKDYKNHSDPRDRFVYLIHKLGIIFLNTKFEC